MYFTIAKALYKNQIQWTASSGFGGQLGPDYAEGLVRRRLFLCYVGGTLLASSRRSLRILATLKKIWAPIRG